MIFLGGIIIIYADTREPQPEIWEIISRLDCTVPKVEFKKLDLGDYLLENGSEKILIERKEIHDFTANYVELKDRMDRMRQAFDNTALIIEGNWTVRGGKVCLWRGSELCPSMSEAAFYNFKLSQQKRGSYFDVTKDLSETIRLLCHWHNYLPKAGMNPVRKSKSAVEWISSLPGIGGMRAFAIRGEYLTPRIALEKIDEWLPKKARQTIDRW